MFEIFQPNLCFASYMIGVHATLVSYFSVALITEDNFHFNRYAMLEEEKKPVEDSKTDLNLRHFICCRCEATVNIK